MDTICHNPAVRLHGLLLDDYNNTKCEMKERKGMGYKFFICSCTYEECNEYIYFSPCKSVWFLFGRYNTECPRFSQ